MVQGEGRAFGPWVLGAASPKSVNAYLYLGSGRERWKDARSVQRASRWPRRSPLRAPTSRSHPNRRIGQAGAYALFGYARASRQHVDGWCCTPARRSARTSGSECTAQARVRQAGLAAGAAHVATGAKATARQVEDAPDSCKGVRNALVTQTIPDLGASGSGGGDTGVFGFGMFPVLPRRRCTAGLCGSRLGAPFLISPARHSARGITPLPGRRGIDENGALKRTRRYTV